METCEIEQRIRFDQRYANWLAARAAHAAAANDDDSDRLTDQEDEAARLLFVTPAVRPYHVWQKIEAFEFYFCGDGECEWTDEREVAFFGCIKADLARFGIGKGP